jgi:hypothetical protein
MPQTASEASIEAEIKTKGLNAPRLTPADIDAVIVKESFVVFPGTTMTVCALTLRNGFIVTGESAAASPENFDEAIGRRIARDNARGRIWALEGYLLRENLSVGKPFRTMHKLAIAEACHEANKALCEAYGDTSQAHWKNAPQWQRDSALNGVDFCIDHPDAPPSANHDSWMAEKLAAGWVHGAVKDPEAKTHPCIVAYGQLPPEQKAKDYVFKAIVGALR